jgi:BirA family biotin operon repressor/biotin-[acetyl-CoA-carboxylase] ligase
MVMPQTRSSNLKWHVRELWRELEPLLPGVAIEVMAQVESTNSALIDRARLSTSARSPGADPGGEPRASASGPPRHGRRSMDAQPCLLVAEEQTGGRGRLGRRWASEGGASLTFSLSLPLSPVDWSGLSLAVGVALAEALDPLTDQRLPRVLLKWPNDLWLRDASAPYGARKLGGVLVETVPVGARRMCIVGVGLNILPRELEGLSAGYACVAELQAPASAPQTLINVAVPLARALRKFESGGFGSFADPFALRDALAGRRIATTHSDCPSGIAEGVDGRGALKVLCADGRRVLVSSGDVSVRPSTETGPAG